MQRTALKFEFKGLTDDDEFYYLEGIFSTPDRDHGDDIVQRQAVEDSIKEFGLPVFRHQHDGNQMPLGTIVSVRFDGEKSILLAKMPKAVQKSSDAAILAKSGAYKGLSIGYRIKKGGVVWEGDVRRITALHIFEVSLVDTPMNKHAELIGVKKRDIKMKLDAIGSLSDAETFIKEMGLSNTESKTFISKLKTVCQRDAESKAERDAEVKKAEEEAKAKLLEEAKALVLKDQEEAKAKIEEEAEVKRLAEEARVKVDEDALSESFKAITHALNNPNK